MSLRYRRRTRFGCLPYLIALLGLAAALFFSWGAISQWIAFVTGLGAQAAASATDQPASADANPASSPTPTEELAPDGFPVKTRKGVLQYTVQQGDAVLLISEKFHLDPNTIFWANTDTLKDNVDLIHVGLKLYILPVDGVYHLSDGKQTIGEIANLYGVKPGDILDSEYNDLQGYSSNDMPPAGMPMVVPGGNRDYTSWLAPIQTGSDGRAYPQGTIHPGSCKEHYIGTGGTGQFINPLGITPYRVTQGFYPWHPGIDLAADKSTPVGAADTGVVVFAGWHRDGYGNLVILDHGNGFTTYYGHLQTRFVGCGDQVRQGQQIGEMGKTGNASGVHLHFEIRQQEVPQNPTTFVAFVDARKQP